MGAEPVLVAGRESGRSEAYRLLSACLCLPEREMLLAENVYDQLASALRPIQPAAALRAGSMGREAAGTDEQTLRVDFARLFVGPGPLLAPPYGSVYLEPAGRVLGATTFEVLAFYRECGLDVDRETREIPDHIALELEFLHHLGQRAARLAAGSEPVAEEEVLARRDSFRARYVAPWVPIFCGRVRENASTRYFRDVADCLDLLFR